MLWQELKQIYAAGLYDYFDSLYNYLDFAVLTLYITSFTMRYISILKVRLIKRNEDIIVKRIVSVQHCHQMLREVYNTEIEEDLRIFLDLTMRQSEELITTIVSF